MIPRNETKFIDSAKDMILWLRSQGAIQVRVGDVGATFSGGPPPKPAEESNIPERKRPEPGRVDQKKNPIGAKYGVTDDIALAST